MALVGLLALAALAVAVWMPRQVPGTLGQPPPLASPSLPSAAPAPDWSWLRPPGGATPDDLRDWLDAMPTVTRVLLLPWMVRVGAYAELWDEIAALVTDPRTALRDLVRLPDVGEMLRSGASGVAGLPGYIAALRHMGAADAASRLAFDFGRFQLRYARRFFLKRARRAARRPRDRDPGNGRGR